MTACEFNCSRFLKAPLPRPPAPQASVSTLASRLPRIGFDTPPPQVSNTAAEAVVMGSRPEMLQYAVQSAACSGHRPPAGRVALHGSIALVLALVLGACSGECACRGPFLFRQDIRELTVYVPEMAGPACAEAARNAVMKQDGVLGATPDLDARTLTVRYDSRRLATKNIERALAMAGFNVGGFPVNAEARARLPQDCIWGEQQ